MSQIKPTIGIVTAMLSLTACESEMVKEARKAEADGRIIDNGIMGSLYPDTFNPGNPPYLERDFEAGANFICDQIELKRGDEICSDADINWR